MIKLFLERFIELASKNPEEIPSFTQIYREGNLLAEKFNKVEENATTHMHSEILCIESAQRIIDNKFLNEVIYFLEATKTEGITSLSIESIYSKNHFPKLTLHHSEEIETIVKDFFKDRRG